MQKSIKISKFNIFNSSSGFTLVEMLVSVFIIAVITGIFLSNYHATNKRSLLINAVQDVAGNIKLAQSYSLGYKEYSPGESPGRWGVYFATTTPNSYILFIDRNLPSSYYDVGEEVMTIDLPEGISIDSISGSSVGDTENVSLVFWPPSGRTSIDCSSSPDYDIAIRFKESTSGTIKTILVNFLGLVDVIN